VQALLRARYVVPVEAPIIEDGIVAVEDGLILGIGPSRDFSRRAATDYGDAVICPAFVNAHTHLELSGFRGRVPPGRSFTDWLERLMRVTRSEPPSREKVQEAVRTGVTESIQSGVGTVGDITHFPAWTRAVLAESPIRTVSFGEVIAIGTRRSLLSERLAAAALSVRPSRRLRIGISPHAPYTVEPAGLWACAAEAESGHLPVAVHVLESPDEEAFTRRGEGPLADYLRALGVWDDRVPVAGVGPIELLESTGLLVTRTLLVHVNYASDADIARIAASGASVVICPRTHDAFGHTPHRFRDMLRVGINVCVGTDSLASNPSMSILEELAFLKGRDPDLSPDLLLALGTIHGARALGLADECGSLRPGKAADVVVLPLRSTNDGWDSILLEAPCRPLPIMICPARAG